MKKVYLSILIALLSCVISFTVSAQTLTAAVTNPSCDGAHNGSVILTASGGTAPYLYSLDGSTWQSSNVFTGLDGGGSFTAYVTDASTQDAFVDFTTDLGPSLGGIVTVTPAACFGGSNGVITIQPTNETAPYTFTLVGEGVSSSDPVISFGQRYAAPYQVDITDALGCFGTVYATIADGDSIRAHTTMISRSCAGSWDGYISINFDNGAPPYMMSSPTVSTTYLPGTSSQLIGIPTTGFQTIAIQDVDGCIGQIALVFPDGPPAATSITGNTSICTTGGSTQLSGSGQATSQGPYYQWAPSTGLDNSTIANPVATPAVTTTYTLTTGTGSSAGNYCISNTTVTINVINLETPSIELNASVLSVANPQSSVNYTWQQYSNGIWEDITNGNNYTLSSYGEYRVKAVNGSCEQYSSSITGGNASRNPFAIAMYPNPASNILNISELKINDGWQTLEIISYQGHKVSPAINIRNQTNVPVNISALNRGIYVAKLTKGDGQTVELRFVKQ